MSTKTWRAIKFKNTALNSLPFDKSKEYRTHRQVKGFCYTKADITRVKDPQLVAVSPNALKTLGLDESCVKDPDFVEYFSGNKLLTGSEIAAHSYCGHQYGFFSGQLGDGATVYVGEIDNNGQTVELQLKGCGRTPFSRAGADGRKVLRSTVREFLASEAMHFLGIPTTRAATCITSGTFVDRDVSYDGNPIKERVSILGRFAPTFLRIGSLQICDPADEETKAHGPSWETPHLIENICNYTIDNFYPQLAGPTIDQRYKEFFNAVLYSSAKLVSQWQSVGFCHGTNNTDNVSLVGVTLDYGPFAFLEEYDPDHICNASDHWALFKFDKQPEMMKWSIQKLANSMSSLFTTENSSIKIDMFDEVYKAEYRKIMFKKLGLFKNESKDDELLESLLKVMYITGADYSKTFRILCEISASSSKDEEVNLIDRILSLCADSTTMKHIYRKKETSSSEAIVRSMWILQTRPDLVDKYVKKAEQATLQLNNRQIVRDVHNIANDSKKQRDLIMWKEWVSNYRERLKSETVSSEERSILMKNINPRFILKNYILQRVIEETEKGNYDDVNTVLELISHPYDDYPHNFCSNKSLGQKYVALYDKGRPRIELKRKIT
ncbi:DgyrCDS2691 [Dimorphilus gyrociliatus]|uniref:Selenoprotein O n=1 Tax=Dimorphilus gyrociliatus TaxID=2664684 RepID=A0A7I8VG67_9ANNE|nr:DgyrCDS2691 [Dimorphilus gyrociliatus]